MRNADIDPLTSGSDPCPGRCDTLAAGMRRILAPNPSPMTYHGTNTYVLGHGAVAVIDPGPDIPAHQQAILAALGPKDHVAAILVTHSHLDHSPLARPLADATGAPIYAFGPSGTGQSPVMQSLSAAGLTGGGEGVDRGFIPDTVLADGDTVALGDTQIEAIWTPGHMGNHLSFAWAGHLFCGDLVMGWASTMVSPPDGDLAAFYASCAKLRRRAETVFYPAHGAPITDPPARIDWLVAHRTSREAQIRAALRDGAASLHQLTQRVYTDVDPALLPAAARNVLAHLIDLHDRQIVRARPSLSVDALFDLTE